MPDPNVLLHLAIAIHKGGARDRTRLQTLAPVLVIHVRDRKDAHARLLQVHPVRARARLARVRAHLHDLAQPVRTRPEHIALGLAQQLAATLVLKLHVQILVAQLLDHLV